MLNDLVLTAMFAFNFNKPLYINHHYGPGTRKVTDIHRCHSLVHPGSTAAAFSQFLQAIPV